MAANDGRVLRSDAVSPVGTVVSAASTLVDVHSIRLVKRSANADRDAPTFAGEFFCRPRVSLSTME
jgi:hypothetical protein